jgi:hypothetical protein
LSNPCSFCSLNLFVRDEDSTLDFHELDEPSPEQGADVAARTAKRVIKLLEEAGRSLDSELSHVEVEELSTRQRALASRRTLSLFAIGFRPFLTKAPLDRIRRGFGGAIGDAMKACQRNGRVISKTTIRDCAFRGAKGCS